MPVIDMTTLKPVGEFGSKAWGEACVEAAIRMLEAAKLPSSITWAFSEDYTYPPSRLMEGGRKHAGYYLMVKNGKISGGDGILEEARAIPGFHAKVPWASICNQSGAFYGREGGKQRSAEEEILFAAVEEYVGRENPMSLDINKEGKSSIMLDPVGPWPAEVGKALGEGSEEGNGLHNIAAALQTNSPEYSDIPVTELRVPIFGKMTEEQKQIFILLCGIEL
ncbi:MAG: hypothetical protein ACJ0Q6_07045 [Candidatus Azotimanducaceae bacterium]|uniref:Uncharacterized protein n=1 Tax=OM182 bacterium TaxID=2510334 RepID=A0A520S3C6_9GAMM|nr:hypothetical protein [Gammaproteobacteria bacterium]RZO76982.1 MAG: hypothetical protein EVA68_02885 [OM182 bacterium]